MKASLPTRKTFLSFLVLATALSTITVFAQGSIADACGQTTDPSKACTLADIKTITKGVFSLVISIGLPLLVVSIAYRFIKAWFALQQGNANAYKEAIKKTGDAIVGFMIIVALLGGIFIGLLRYLGVKDRYLTPFKNIFSSVQVESYHVPYQGLHGMDVVRLLVPTASAQTAASDLNPVEVTSLYDFIVAVLRLIMRFFIYPALIVMWVWTGFSFVLAQGAPDALTKAKKWLWWAFISTFIIFMIQAFLSAVRGSVNKILSDRHATEEVRKS